jgi:5-methyltetrahydropteroyltriglutamate--homocysteine methyltransferase
MADIAAIYRAELADLAARGVTYVQLDDTTFTLFCDPKWKARFAARGYDPDVFVEKYVAWINSCVAGKPAGMTIALHQCRGNNQGEWLFNGGYDPIAEKVYTQLNIDTFFLEYDSERAGGFEPLRFMPHDKFVVLGLISSKSPVMEDPNALLRRLEAASQFFPRENMGISPQCGFASTAPGNPLTEEEQWAKLALVVKMSEKGWT